MKELKIKTLSICLLFFTTIIFSQEEKSQSVFVADSTWFKEIIELPFGFAREINYEGFSDIRFAKGWAKKDSPEFWTYTYAWHVKGIKEQSVELLEQHMSRYFNGLSRPNNNDTRVFPMATVLFIKSQDTQEADYVGKLRLYDRFHTKDMITLYCQVKPYYCESKEMTTIVFRFSAKPFKDGVWQKFNEVQFKEDICIN